MPERTLAEWESLYYETLGELVAVLGENARLEKCLRRMEEGDEENEEARGA